MAKSISSALPEWDGGRDGQARWGLARPVPAETALLLTRYVGFLVGGAGLGGVLFVAVAWRVALHPLTLVVVTSVALLFGTWFLILGYRRSPFIERNFTPFAYGLLLLTPPLITIAQYSAGPRTLVAVALYVEVPIFAFYLVPRPIAAALVALVALQFGALISLQPGYDVPGAQWLFVSGTLASIGAIFGGLLTRAVDESTRLSRLRRFLSPQVAEAILSSGPGLLEPHRRQIAVLFCDLRGFTRFSSTSEPEEIVDVLDDYFHTVGEVIVELGATVGSFTGDGIMAYFNDPVPCTDPAAKAVELATRLEEPLDGLVTAWRRRGFQLSYGIGVSYGYATLGVIGFQGRNDYTALGSVVNLAARLSDHAGPGEILIDQRTHDAVCDSIIAQPVFARLKGFDEDVAAYRVVAADPALEHAGDNSVAPPATDAPVRQ
jgi:class 3 adenylate cyclase